MMPFNYLELVNLDKLIELTSGDPEVKLGMIDGPVDLGHPDLVDARIQEITGNPTDCIVTKSQACSHGTFVTGILGSKRGSDAPSICPDCTIIVRPIFSEDKEPTNASPKELAQSILDCIRVGAKAINMSVALSHQSIGSSELREALDYAAKRGIIVVAAAGNGGTLASSVITSHPWVIPVTACDHHGRLMEGSNLGSSIGQRGLMAPGYKIKSLRPDRGHVTLNGTSLAAPFVTGAVGLLWSLFPDASSTAMRSALMQIGNRRRSIIPPLMDAWSAYQLLSSNFGYPKSTMRRGKIMDHIEEKEEKISETAQLSASVSIPEQDARAQVVPQICGTCQKSLESAISGEASEKTYVYAIGKIEPRFPSISIEKEFAQAVGRGETKGLIDQETKQSILLKRENRYLARKICWVMTIEGLETYILKPRDPGDLDLLLEAVRSMRKREDLDVIIGIMGPIAPPQLCNGLQVPIVFFDQIYSFDLDSLIKSLPNQKEKAAEEFEKSSLDLFDRIMQIADNAGATNEHRAINYLAIRYHEIYNKMSEAVDLNCSLTGIEAAPSRLSGARKVVSVIFTFTNRTTDVAKKFFVRVDVTEEFPFLVTKMSPYYDR